VIADFSPALAEENADFGFFFHGLLLFHPGRDQDSSWSTPDLVE
jgi:hypothetical protein